MGHYNELAERATISHLLSDGELIKETALRAEHFYYDNGRYIFEAAKRLSDRNEKIDHITVIEELRRMNMLDGVGGSAFIFNMKMDFRGYEGFEHHERIVIDCWKVRKGIELGKSFLYKIDDTSDVDALHDHITQMQEIVELGHDKEENGVERLAKWYESRVNRKGGIVGITTGYDDLDAILGGYRDECLYILAARPAVGKTAFALCSAISTSNKGAITAIFSLEMPMEQLLDRMACALGGINTYKLECPQEKFTDDDWMAFNSALAKLESLIKSDTLKIYDKPGMTIQEIRAKLRNLRRKNPDRKIIAMADYLQLIRSTNKHRDRRLEVSEVSGSLKELSRVCKIPMVALAQLSRSVENRQDKRPLMSDLKESGDIEADADVITFLYRDDYYDPESEKKNIVELIVAKNRHGATGTVELAFFREFSRYANLKRQP